MKNINKIFVVGILILFLLASVISAPGIKNKTQDNNIVFDFTFSEPQFKKITVSALDYDRIIIDGLTNTNNIDEPRLPMKSVKILLPYARAVENLVLTISDKISYGYDHIVEVGRNLMTINDQYDVAIYNSKNDIERIFPEQLYSIVGTHMFRGYQILYVNLYPVQYDSETGEIFFYQHMNLVIETKESSPIDSFRGIQGDRDVITNMVDNPAYVHSYPDHSGSTADNTYEYVIITDDDYSKPINRDYSFNDLAQSKINKGITAGIFTVQEIVSNSDYGVNGKWGDNNPANPFFENPIIGNIEHFDDDQARIRNFIRYAYTELGTNYVLLGGDADFKDQTQNIVPVRCIYANETGLPLADEWFEEDDIPSDVYYACLDGNFNYDGDERWGEDEIGNDKSDIDEADLLAEVWVGRACIDSVEEVSHFVMKTLAYDVETDPYLKDILFVGEHLGFPGVSEWGGNYKDLLLPYVSDDYNVETLYDRDLPQSWSLGDIMNILNTDTPNIINHDGHSYYGYNMRMINSDVDSLTNDKYFFVYSHGCMAGGFDNPNGYDCIAEHFTVKTKHAAVGGIWNARFGLGSNNTLDSPSGAYDISFYKALFEEDIGEMGRASHYSKEDNIPRINENGMRWCYYETNLFGDPQLSLTDLNHPPDKPNIDGPRNVKVGETHDYTIYTTDPEGNDINYFIDWGDGNTEWFGPYSSGEEFIISITFEEKGTVTIYTTAVDIKGAVSETATLIVTVPRDKTFIDNYLFGIWGRFQKLLPIIIFLLKID